MATINWDEVEKSQAKKYKDYAPDGNYTVKVKDVESRDTSNGKVQIQFNFEEDDNYKYPYIRHGLGLDNANWRQWHYKQMMVVLGLSDDQAKKSVEICEKNQDREALVKAYVQMLNQVIAKKKPSVEIEVYHIPGNEYDQGEFVDERVAMPKKTGDYGNIQTTGEVVEIEGVGEAEEITIEDVPF